MSHFAVNLAKYRLALGYKYRAAFARFLGIDPKRYHHYESGRNEPSYDDLIRIADILHVSIDDLLRDDTQLLAHYLEGTNLKVLSFDKVNIILGISDTDKEISIPSNKLPQLIIAANQAALQYFISEILQYARPEDLWRYLTNNKDTDTLIPDTLRANLCRNAAKKMILK